MKEIIVPDLGGASDVDVIEILIQVGDVISAEQSLITVESEKASMEIPAPFAGKIVNVTVQVGDKVKQGDVIAQVDVAGASDVSEVAPSAEPEAAAAAAPQPEVAASQTIPLVVPDIGSSEPVDVIAVDFAVGDTVAQDAPLITLESDTASMDVPASAAGKITAVHVRVGDKVQTGDVIGEMVTSDRVSSAAAPAQQPAAPAPSATTKQQSPAKPTAVATTPVSFADVYAGPAVRRLGREIGVDLTRVKGSGQHGRITRDDVMAYTKQVVTQAQQGSSGGAGFALDLSAPNIDFTQFGEVREQPLNKIKRLTAKNMSRNWLMVPHVTQFDEADITEMEAFRQANKQLAANKGVKFTPLVFIMKALAQCLLEFPQFNSSLSPDGQTLILKQYCNIGIAIDTPNGLVVGVVRDVANKGLIELAQAMGALSEKARDKGLSPADMAGGCMTISSLGGISGTAFTPIVNVPEVAILGVSRSKVMPVFQDGEFVPRLILPLSLSYDHRVIDGAEAARFTQHLSQLLSDIRLLTL